MLTAADRNQGSISRTALKVGPGPADRPADPNRAAAPAVALCSVRLPMSELPSSQPHLPSPASEATPSPLLTRLPQRLHRRLAALSLVGAALVALPVLQLLRYQTAELNALADGRAGLDPVGRTVFLQRGLLLHRDIAGLVLRGQEALEPERKLRQVEVDQRMAALMVALTSGSWEQAIGESDAQREDWLRLARQVLERGIDATASDQAHRLLVEQGLQIIDLLAEADPARAEHRSGLGPDMSATMGAVHALPRLIWQTTALPTASDPRDPDARQRQMAIIEAGLARTLGRLEIALGRRSSATATPDPAAPRVALVQAGAAAGAAVERYFSLLRRTPEGEPEIRAATGEAVQAQLRLFDAALAVANEALVDRTRVVAQGRVVLLCGLSALALLAGLLALSLAQGLRLLQAAEQWRGDAAAAPTGGPVEGRAAANVLMQRLREPEAPAAVAAKPAAAPADQGTEPPAG